MTDPGPMDIGVSSDAVRGHADRHDLGGRRVRPDDDRRRGLAVAAAFVVVALGALLTLGMFGDSDDAPSEPDEAALADDSAGEPAGGGSERAGDGSAAGDGGGSDPAGDGSAAGDASGVVSGFAPPSVSHLRSDEVAERFANEIDDGEVRYGVAYVADGSFTVLDRRGITVPETVIAQDFATASGQTGLSMLASGGRTWAIDSVSPDRSYLVSNGYVVVEGRSPGIIAVVDPRDPTSVEVMSSALPAPGIELPEGAEVLWVQRRGLLVLPRTGGTFEFGGTHSGLVRISGDRAVAASLGGTVYERCDDRLVCAYYVERLDTEAEVGELPDPVGTRFSLSPDADWIVATLPDGRAFLRSLTGSTEYELGIESIAAIDWAPDSSYLAVLGEASLEMIGLPEGRRIVMEVDTAPDDDALLVFLAP